MRIGEFRVAAGENCVDLFLRQPHLFAEADMRLPHIIGVPMLRDHQDADLDLPRRQRALLVEERADVLHPACDCRRVDPDLIRSEYASAAGGKPLEDCGLFGRELVLGNVQNAIHGAEWPRQRDGRPA
jgi:hypothetical protein